jgi:hypothetical protein
LWGYFFIFLYVYIFIFPAHPGKEYFIYFSAGHPEKMYFIYFQAGFPSGYVFYISIFYLFSPQARWAHLRLGLISRLRGGYFTYFPSAASRRYFSYFYIFWPPRKDVFYLFSGWISQRICFLYFNILFIFSAGQMGPFEAWPNFTVTRRIFYLFSFCCLQAVFFIFLHFLATPKRCILFILGWPPRKDAFDYF